MVRVRSRVQSSLTAPHITFITMDNYYCIGYESTEWTIQWTILLTVSIVNFMSTSGNNIVYPRSRLTLIKGKHYVIISVPVQMRHLFKDQRDKRLSTGTSDLRQAQLKQHDLAQQIYDKFDEALSKSTERHDEQTDDFAIDCISGLAEAFNHKSIPDLMPTTAYNILVDFKKTCDVYADLVENSTSKEDQIGRIEKTTALYSKMLVLDDPETIIERSQEILELLDDGPHPHETRSYAGRYRQHITHSFWQDLLISSTREQNLPEHKIEPFEGPNIITILKGNKIFPQAWVEKQLGWQGEPISRPPRVEPVGIRTLSTVMDEYLADMRLKQKVIDTQKKLTRWNKQFLDVMGDLKLSEIEPKHAYEYIRKVLAKHPTRSNQTLKDYLWGVQNLLKYCVECGHIKANPFRDIDLKKYGAEPEETLAYSNEEIKIILAHDWNKRDRLLLSIVATTGMRPSEAGNMTWERFNDTEYAGIRYVTTTDVDGEKVRVKNAGSKRDVPLHPDLVFPQKGAGRLFDYKKDEDGRCSTDIAHEINPILEQLVPHPNKSLRSFRKTFKIMMRDAGVGEEVHDAITGHRQGDTTGRKSYGGMGLKVKFKAISKLDISFLGSAV